MSIHTLSDLAVQDISDESASVHSGGVNFNFYNNLNGTGFNTSESLSDSSYILTKRFPSQDNDIESVSISNAVPGLKYQIKFFDRNDWMGSYAPLTLGAANANKYIPLATTWRNKTSSFTIQRVA